MPYLLNLVGLLLILATPAAAAVDLTAIDRSLAKEPVYESKHPQYCLLVFGAEAKTRVWLVFDGDTLYIDRNGNGDLTEPGERVTAVKSERMSGAQDTIRRFRLIGSKDLRDGIAGPALPCLPKVAGLLVSQQIINERSSPSTLPKSSLKTPMWVSLATTDGWEQAADTASVSCVQDAPVVHFLGPLQVVWGAGKAPRIDAGDELRLSLAMQAPGEYATVLNLCTPKTAYATGNIEFRDAKTNAVIVSRQIGLKDPGG